MATIKRSSTSGRYTSSVKISDIRQQNTDASVRLSIRAKEITHRLRDSINSITDQRLKSSAKKSGR